MFLSVFNILKLRFSPPSQKHVVVVNQFNLIIALLSPSCPMSSISSMSVTPHINWSYNAVNLLLILWTSIVIGFSSDMLFYWFTIYLFHRMMDWQDSIIFVNSFDVWYFIQSTICDKYEAYMM